MSIANLCVLRGYSNGDGWFDGRLVKALRWKGLPFEAQGKPFEAQGKPGVLWLSAAVEKSKPVPLKITWDAAPIRVLYSTRRNQYSTIVGRWIPRNQPRPV